MLYTKQRCKRLREKGSPSQIFYHLLNAYNQSEVLLHVELSIDVDMVKIIPNAITIVVDLLQSARGRSTDSILNMYRIKKVQYDYVILIIRLAS